MYIFSSDFGHDPRQYFCLKGMSGLPLVTVKWSVVEIGSDKPLSTGFGTSTSVLPASELGSPSSGCNCLSAGTLDTSETDAVGIEFSGRRYQSRSGPGQWAVGSFKGEPESSSKECFADKISVS